MELDKVLPSIPIPPALPTVERLAVNALQDMRGEAPAAPAGDAIHILTPAEMQALRRIERNAILRAMLAGALSATASACAAYWADPLIHQDIRSGTYWAIVIGVTVAATSVEMAFLYWDALRSVKRLAGAAGLDLFPSAGPRNVAMANALARAAMELPNPHEPVLGVNPLREASRPKLYFSTALYKLKVSLTNFLVKALVRRLLGRTTVRLIEFLTLPISAAWNGIVTWMVLREARLRVMGPSAASEYARRLFPDPAALIPATREACLRAVACAIVRTEDLHPNLVALLHELAQRLGAAPVTGLDDTGRFLELLRALDSAGKKLALETLLLAAVLDGRFTPGEQRLLQEAAAACGVPRNDQRARRVLRAFIRGNHLELGETA